MGVVESLDRYKNNFLKLAALNVCQALVFFSQAHEFQHMRWRQRSNKGSAGTYHAASRSGKYWERGGFFADMLFDKASLRTIGATSATSVQSPGSNLNSSPPGYMEVCAHCDF